MNPLFILTKRCDIHRPKPINNALIPVILLLIAACLHSFPATAQGRVLTLDQSIGLACGSSLSAHSAKNTFLSNYWAFRSYKAARLPSLSLSMIPVKYSRAFTSRYDSETNQDVYRQQQSLYSYGNLAIEQNVDVTGGTLYFDSELSYYKNIGTTSYQQFSTVPIRVGYSQNLIGYNGFKWEKQIEPLKYQKAKRKLLYSLEEIAETAASHFFTLAMAQVTYELAQASLASSDTLYTMGVERQQIASISQADLLTLKLDRINAGNSLRNAEIDLKKATSSLMNYLNIDKETQLKLELPEKPEQVEITTDKALAFVRLYNPDYLTNKQSLLEAKQSVEKTVRSSKMEASLDMSIGFNQVASSFTESFLDPLEQDVVSLSLTVPLVDWGVRKGKVNMAKNKLNVTQLTIQQDEQSLEDEIIMTVSDFNVQQGMIYSTEEARTLADMAFDATKQRYLIGKADMSSLTLSRNRQEEARKNYISALKNYWLSYLKIRKLTLYDFVKHQPLTTNFESQYAIR